MKKERKIISFIFFFCFRVKNILREHISTPPKNLKNANYQNP